MRRLATSLCEKMPLATAVRQNVFHTAWQAGQRLQTPGMALACAASEPAAAATAPMSTSPSRLGLHIKRLVIYVQAPHSLLRSLQCAVSTERVSTR